MFFPLDKRKKTPASRMAFAKVVATFDPINRDEAEHNMMLFVRRIGANVLKGPPCAAKELSR